MEEKIRVTRYDCICERCAYRWVTRSNEPAKICPTCKSAHWNTPKEKRRNERDKTVWGESDDSG